MDKSRKKKYGESITWTHREIGSFVRDDFSAVAGPVGTAHPAVQPQIRVLKERIFEGKDGDAAKVFKHLYPGDPEAVVVKVWAAMQKRGCKEPLTVGEWFVFLGLMCGSVLYTEKGRELWRNKKDRERAFSRAPGFAQYMTCDRFEDIKACAVAGCTDLSQQGTEKWFKIKFAVDSFNKRRQQVVIQSEVLTPDETMSPMCPRSTSHGAGEGKLPHYSFVPRKPEPHGTEFKTVCDGRSGVMLYMEIQEKAEDMALKRFRTGSEVMGGNSACGMRLALGATGRL